MRSRMGEAPSRLSVTLDRGALRLSSHEGVVVSDLRLALRVAGRAVKGTLVAMGGARYRLTADAGFEVRLELAEEALSNVVIAMLDYAGPPLQPDGGVRVAFELDEFARGLALKRLKRWWLAPVFTSDPRLLPGDGMLLLWR